MQKRDFLFMLKRLQIVDPTHLTASRIISILADEDATIRLPDAKTSGSIRLDIEVWEHVLVTDRREPQSILI